MKTSLIMYKVIHVTIAILQLQIVLLALIQLYVIFIFIFFEKVILVSKILS